VKAIFDRIPSAKKFPLPELLSAVQGVLKNPQEQAVTIRRLGGVGRMIWSYESQLDEGRDVIVPFADIQKLAESAEDRVDELWIIVGTTHFGISDSSFLFVQCEDKEIERAIAGHFESVRDIPDIATPPDFDSEPPPASPG
jgi:hypothetical protein